MILYLDSLFAEGRARVVKPLHQIPDTVSKLHLLAMREHDRKAVLRHWADGRWHDTPDWRFDRQVIRLGLFLYERVGLRSGEAVVILSPLRREWLLADFASVVQGAVSVAIAPSLTDDALAAALAAAEPRVVFVPDATVAERVERLGEPARSVAPIISFEGPMRRDRPLVLSEVLDLGGTLDTPERAGLFRARAREVSPAALAVRHARPGEDGSVVWESLTHGAVIDRLQRLWLQHPAHRGHEAYVVGPDVTLPMRLALYALVGDGYTAITLGTAGRDAEEIATLRPHTIVAPPAVLERAGASASSHRGGARGLRKWLARAVALAAGGRRRGAGRPARDRPRSRVRWISSTAPLEPGVVAHGEDAVTIQPGPRAT